MYSVYSKRFTQGDVLNLHQVGASDLISANRYAFVRYACQPDTSVAMDWLKDRTSSGDVFEPLLRCTRQPQRTR